MILEKKYNITIDADARTVIAGTGIPAEIIWERFMAGEKAYSLSWDYALPIEDIHNAIRYWTLRQQGRLLDALRECVCVDYYDHDGKYDELLREFEESD